MKMKNYFSNRKQFIAFFAFFGLIMATVGVTVAWFSYTQNGINENSINSGKITFIYEENEDVGNGILLEDAMPMPDSYGKQLDNNFDFKVTSTAKIAKIPYEITVSKTSNSDDLSEYLKLYLTKVSGNNEEEKVLSMYNELDDSTNPIAVLNNEKTLFKSEIQAGADNLVTNYRLRMWLNDNPEDGSVLNYQQSITHVCSDPQYDNKTDCEANHGQWLDVAQSAEFGNFVLKVNVYADGESSDDADLEMADSTEIVNIKINDSLASSVDNESYDFYKELVTLDESVLINVNTENEDAKVDIEKITPTAMNTNIRRLSTKKVESISLGDNYYKITVTSANGQVVGEPKILKLFVKEPIAVINVLTTELSTNAEISIDYLNHTDCQYRIGKNGTWTSYPTATEDNPHPTINITSYDAINYANSDKTVTIYAKATDSEGIRETSKVVNVLDLDMPTKPVISISTVYPTLGTDGVSVTGNLSVTFADRDDIENYISFDNGETWAIYTGNEKLNGSVIKAKSVKTSTGLTSTAELNVATASDSIDGAMYDSDDTTYGTQAKNTTKYFKINSNIIGRTARIYLNEAASATSAIKFYDADRHEIVLDNPVMFNYPVTLAEIPANTTYIGFVSGSSALKVSEIGLRPNRSSSTLDYPLITVNDIDYTYPKITSIEYPSGYTNQYSLDNGNTWSNYVGPVSLTRVGGAVFARTLDNAGNVVSTSSFNAFKIGSMRAASVLKAIGNSSLLSGESYGEFEIGDEEYSAHMYIYDSDQVWNQNMIFGDEDDVASGTDASQMATRMVIVKVNGNLTINSGVTVAPFATEYGGPKGFMLYVTGTLTNYGVIDNSHGAYAEGQNVILWKNTDETYEVVPANGATGGTGFALKGASNAKSGNPGNSGISSGNLRATGGGGTGSLYFGDEGTNYTATVQDGATGTSYSGGSGSGGIGINTRSSRAAGIAYPNGGAGGSGMGARGETTWASRNAGGGAGNPGGAGMLNWEVDTTCSGSNGTGGLLIVYAGAFNNVGIMKANGSSGGAGQGSGGASGGGSINVFYGDLISLGSFETNGGFATKYGTYSPSGKGGDGTVNVGSIKTNQYIVLNEVKIDMPDEIYLGDSYVLPSSYLIGQPISGTNPTICKLNDTEITTTKELALGTYTVTCSSTLYPDDTVSKTFSVVSAPSIPSTFTEVVGDSILDIVGDNNFTDRYYNFKVDNEEYPVHIYTYNSDQVWNQEMIFGDANDVASGTDATQMAKNMVIVKVNGNLTVDTAGVVKPYYDSLYGGPKGFMLYVTGSLVNNGVIDNSHGAYAEGQNVYLWKNTDQSYEFVPAVGAAGAASRTATREQTYNGNTGKAASTVTTSPRATGGGASGGVNFGDCTGYTIYSGAGAAGTSYSGGSGGGASSRNAYSSYNPNNAAQPNGGTGGVGSGTRYSTGWASRYAGGGAGNPGGKGGSDGNGNTNSYTGENGTGGLLIIYANSLINGNKITANGSKGGFASGRASGGSSGGGSINIFYINSYTNKDTVEAAGGTYASGSVGGLGGEGSVNIGSIATGTYVPNE